jgi:SGNH hydrolase-like domain, acetyltransferase AlgX
MRILAGIPGSLEPTRPRVAGNFGPGAGRLQFIDPPSRVVERWRTLASWGSGQALSLLRNLCLYAAILGCLAVPKAFAGDLGPLSESQQKFVNELAAKLRSAESEHAAVITGVDGWFFLSSDIRFLSVGQFWGTDAAKVSRAHKPESADPIPAIVDFHDQLKRRGIDLLLMPIPPKAAIYPEKIVPNIDLHGETAAPFLARFYDELRKHEIDVVDLAPAFLQNHAGEHGPVFCKTDTHWSGFGCVLAAQTIKEKIREKLAGQPRKDYAAEWKETTIKGDLGDLAGPDAKKIEPEKIAIRTVSDKETGAAINPDPNSPLLIIGDSHTLVFHDFLAEKSGLLDQVAYEIGFAPDLIGTRGSGATSVRVSLYRRARKDPGYLAKKKVIVWCFAAREFTESDQGWDKVPVGQ